MLALILSVNGKVKNTCTFTFEQQSIGEHPFSHQIINTEFNRWIFLYRKVWAKVHCFPVKKEIVPITIFAVQRMYCFRFSVVKDCLLSLRTALYLKNFFLDQPMSTKYIYKQQLHSLEAYPHTTYLSQCSCRRRPDIYKTHTNGINLLSPLFLSMNARNFPRFVPGL